MDPEKASEPGRPGTGPADGAESTAAEPAPKEPAIEEAALEEPAPEKAVPEKAEGGEPEAKEAGEPEAGGDAEAAAPEEPEESAAPSEEGEAVAAAAQAPEEDAEEPHGQRRRWAVALAAAAVLAVGGGTAWLVSGPSGTDRVQDTADVGAADADTRTPVPPGPGSSPTEVRPPDAGGGPTAGSPSASPGPLKGARTYTASANRLTVWFWSGVCEEYALQADESTPGEVAVRVVVTEPRASGEPCVMMAKYNSVSATLKQPLGSRTVVDAATGAELAPRGRIVLHPMPGGAQKR